MTAQLRRGKFRAQKFDCTDMSAEFCIGYSKLLPKTLNSRCFSP